MAGKEGGATNENDRKGRGSHNPKRHKRRGELTGVHFGKILRTVASNNQLSTHVLDFWGFQDQAGNILQIHLLLITLLYLGVPRERVACHEKVAQAHSLNPMHPPIHPHDLTHSHSFDNNNNNNNNYHTQGTNTEFIQPGAITVTLARINPQDSGPSFSGQVNIIQRLHT